MTNLLHKNDKIRYSSQQMFENPTVNFDALCNWCAKIASCSSQLIFTFLYVGSINQNAGL